MAHGPRKTHFDFGGNPDHVALGLSGVRIGVMWAGEHYTGRIESLSATLVSRGKSRPYLIVCFTKQDRRLRQSYAL